jgi:hypothetical protein
LVEGWSQYTPGENGVDLVPMAASEDPAVPPSGPTTDLIVNFTRTAQSLFRAGGVGLKLQACAGLHNI